jgi:hypothetical protein
MENMDEIDRANAALKRYIEAAITDPEIAAIPLLVERIKRFAPLLVPERGADSDDGVMAVAESLAALQGYCDEALTDPRILEIDRQKLRDALVVVLGFGIDDDGKERTPADLPWTKQGQARRAAKARGAGSPTSKAVAWALDALERGEYPSKNTAAAAAALLFGANVDSVLRALRPSKLR